MPMAGMMNSGLIQAQGYRTVIDPYSGKEVIAMPAIPVDWAVIHVHEADHHGNSYIEGSLYEDLLLVGAARKVLVTCERLLDAPPARVDLPGFLVSYVVEMPGGARPTSCGHSYGYDQEYLLEYLQAAVSEATVSDFIRQRIMAGGDSFDS